jgi:hypothetical protein
MLKKLILVVAVCVTSMAASSRLVSAPDRQAAVDDVPGYHCGAMGCAI